MGQLEENLAESNKELNRLETGACFFDDQPMIELLRERFVKLFTRRSGCLKTQLTRIENELENSRPVSQNETDQLESEEQLATARRLVNQQAELETAKEKVQNYWLELKLVPGTRSRSFLPSPVNSDRLDSLKNKQAPIKFDI